jgi:HEAT repeat protein
MTETQLRDRIIRVAGAEGDQASTRWLEGIVEDPKQPMTLRDRALRMLGRGDATYLRAVYARLEELTLKDRALRLAAEAGDRDNLEWLRSVALDETANGDLRDRAIRSLAESGESTEELVRLYDGASARAARERLIRIFGERGDKAALDKLIAIARTDPDQSLRRFAVRRLAESGDRRAREFLESTVKR